MSENKKRIKYIKFFIISEIFFFLINYVFGNLSKIYFDNILLSIIYLLFCASTLIAVCIIGVKRIFKYTNPFDEKEPTKDEWNQYKKIIPWMLVTYFLINLLMPYNLIKSEVIRMLLDSCIAVSIVFLGFRYSFNTNKSEKM